VVLVPLFIDVSVEDVPFIDVSVGVVPFIEVSVEDVPFVDIPEVDEVPLDVVPYVSSVAAPGVIDVSPVVFVSVVVPVVEQAARAMQRTAGAIRSVGFLMVFLLFSYTRFAPSSNSDPVSGLSTAFEC
jgi:hypothetical protein